MLVSLIFGMRAANLVLFFLVFGIRYTRSLRISIKSLFFLRKPIIMFDLVDWLGGGYMPIAVK